MKEEEFEEKIKCLNLTKEEEFKIRQTEEQNVLFAKIFGEIRRHFG